MKNGFIFLVGLFSAIALAFGGIVIGSHAQFGSLTPYFDDVEGRSFPEQPSGLAARGQLVYAELGCAACHTQQVRRPDFGSDQARGWGERQSVARDYVFQVRPQLGASRLGPDLMNLGGRLPSPPSADELLRLLYAGSETHPSYRFLFETKEIIGQPSDTALRLTGELAAPAGHEIQPSPQAHELVAYLLSLNSTYDYPEARPAAPAAEGAAAQEAKK